MNRHTEARTHQQFYPNRFQVYTCQSRRFLHVRRDRVRRCRASSLCGNEKSPIFSQFISQMRLRGIFNLLTGTRFLSGAKTSDPTRFQRRRILRVSR